MAEGGRGFSRADRVVHTGKLLAGSAVGAALLTLLQVPAGVLVGAVLGSALANRLPSTTSPSPLSSPVRVVGLVLLGSAAGVRLDSTTLIGLRDIAVPLLAAIALLLCLDLALSVVLVRRYAIDPLTAVLACAPGGVSEIAITAAQLGARTGVVLAIHTVRVLAVVVVVLPVLVALLGDA